MRVFLRGNFGSFLSFDANILDKCKNNSSKSNLVVVLELHAKIVTLYDIDFSKTNCSAGNLLLANVRCLL